MSKINIYKIAAISFLILALLMCWGRCVDRAKLNASISKVNEYEHTVNFYAAKDGTLVANNAVLNTDIKVLKILNDSLISYLDNIKIKDPEVVTIFDTRYRIDSFFIDVPIPCDNTFLVPFSEADSTFSIQGFVNNDGINISSLQFPNRTGVTIGTKRNGLFRRNQTVVAITNSNPHIIVEGISSYTFTEEKKWWEKGSLKFIVGSIAGAATVYLLTK